MFKLEILELLVISSLISGLLILFLNYFGVAFNKTIILIAIGILIIFLDVVLKKRNYSDYGVRTLNKNQFMVFVYFLSLFFIFSFLARVITPSFDFWYFRQMGTTSPEQFLINLLPGLIGLVFADEIYQRGLIQSKLTMSYGSKIALLIGTINFSAAHFGWAYATSNTLYIFMIFISVVFFSFLISALYVYSKNLILSIIAHLFTNLLVAVQIYLHINQMIIIETFLWLIWGLLSILFFKKAVIKIIQIIKAVSKERNRISIFQKILLVLLSILPILIIIFLRSI